MDDISTPPHGQFKHVISLGLNCQAAHQIRRVLNIESAHVLDWLISPHSAIKNIFQSRLAGFFDRDRLVIGEKNRVVDNMTGLQFIHDFNEGEEIDVGYEEKRGKYKELARRFLNVLDGEDSVLFVRQQSGRGDSRHLANDLLTTISDTAPQLPFSILYVTDFSEEVDSEWDSPQILCRSVQKPTPYVWTGDDQGWERILKEALSHQWA